MIRELFLRIFNEYQTAKHEEFADHALAYFIRHDLPDVLRTHFQKHTDLIWKASVGQGGWADSPWLAIFDPLVTTTVQHGYFPFFLFDKDLDNLYLSFNQGMTELRDEFNDAQAREILKNRSKILRQRVSPNYANRFGLESINLKASGPHTRLALYEPGHAFGKKYAKENFVSDEELIEDIESMIELYRLTTLRGGTAEFDFGASFDEESIHEDEKLSLEEKRRLRYHKTIERNPRLVKEVKRIHGYTCEVCKFNFEDVYGPLGHQFIEVHHKIPLSHLSIDQSINLSPGEDFAVVCSNCHRMIHRSNAPENFDEFVAFYNKNIDVFNYKYKLSKVAETESVYNKDNK
jgi:5-methylcytosine-specific restriction protein A